MCHKLINRKWIGGLVDWWIFGWGKLTADAEREKYFNHGWTRIKKRRRGCASQFLISLPCGHQPTSSSAFRAADLGSTSAAMR